jgi:hypothetical protein
MVRDFLVKSPKKIHYGGKVNPQGYCEGRFYLLSQEAVGCLVGLQDTTSGNGGGEDDAQIANLLEPRFKENVLELKTDMFFENLI